MVAMVVVVGGWRWRGGVSLLPSLLPSHLLSHPLSHPLSGHPVHMINSRPNLMMTHDSLTQGIKLVIFQPFDDLRNHVFRGCSLKLTAGRDLGGVGLGGAR